MKALVTGATGFLGSHLLSKLVQEGYEVRALARKTSKVNHLQQDRVEIVYGDLKDRETLQHAIKGVNIVYHAGAAMGGSWEDFEESTIRGTQRMLELSLAEGIKRFVHISSPVVYKVYHLAKHALVSESCPIEHNAERVGPYAYSKVEAERLVFRFYKKGLPVVVVRPGLLYGPEGRIFSPNIGAFVAKRLFVVIGNSDGLLPLTYIENAVDGILLAGTQEEAVGQAYNIVDDNKVTRKEYLKKFKAITHANFFILPSPFDQLMAGLKLAQKFKIGPLRKLPVPAPYGLVTKFKSLRFDSSKAKQELNWQSKVGLEEGLKKTFEWYNSTRSRNGAL